MTTGYIRLPLESSLPMKYISSMDCLTLSNGDSMPAHIHNDKDELIFVINGRGTCYVDKDSVDVEPGTICLFRAQTLHHLCANETGNLEYFSVQFDPNYITDNYMIGNYQYAISTDKEAVPVMKNIFKSIRDAEKPDAATRLGPSKWLYCNALIASALEKLESSDKKIAMGKNDAVFEIWKYIKENSEKKISLALLAQKFLMSTSSLNRQFYAAYHISPIELVIETRIQNAITLLLDTDMSIKEISEYVGYENVSYFTNLFTKRKGCSPSEYRSIQEQNPIVRINSVKMNV